MRYIALALLVFVLAPADYALAQDGPGSYARRTGHFGGAVRLEANYLARDTCQAALSGRRGAPAGQAVGPDTVAVTVVVGPNPGGCGGSRVVTRVMTVSGPSTTDLIQIFFVDPSGRILKVERIKMP